MAGTWACLIPFILVIPISILTKQLVFSLNTGSLKVVSLTYFFTLNSRLSLLLTYNIQSGLLPNFVRISYKLLHS